MKDISELLGCKYPIIQGAMGVISNPEFVAAVSEAGGYGLLATAFDSDPAKLKDRVDRVKAFTEKPFGANLMAIHPMALEFADILIDAGVKAVTTSGGSPKTLVPYLKERGVKVLHVVSNVSNAVKAAAAGGIGDRRGYQAAFVLGAVGAQIGTAFIAAEECIAHANYKNALISASESDTRLMNVEWAQFRVVSTPVAEEMVTKGGLSKSEFSAQGASIEETWVHGDLEAGTIPAGQSTGMIKAIRPVREIIEDMVRDS